MSDFERITKIKHIRKERPCDLCGRKIPKGFSAYNNTGVYEGQFFFSYFCNTCEALINEFREYVTDGWCGCYDDQELQNSIASYDCSTPFQLLNKLRQIRANYEQIKNV